MTDDQDAPRASVADIRALFSSHSVWSSWLEVEACLAEVQAELGLIPQEAAVEIRAKASFDHLDHVAILADVRRTRAPIVSLVRVLSDACEGDAGKYVHWGATTQNVIQTGYALLMAKAHAAFMLRFDDTLAILADIAEAEAATVTVARTNMRQALPITFGFKVAGWIEEWLRNRERLEQAAPRILRAQWGGTVGAMHVLGEAGPEVNRRLGERLGLGVYAIPSRAGLDGFAEYATVLALFAGTSGKIARHLFALMADEFGEVAESLGADVIGSSTMPHKVNPKTSVKIIALATRIRAQAPLALEAMQPSFEGDASCNAVVNAVVEDLTPLAYELVDEMAWLTGSLSLSPDRMRENLEIGGEFLASENLMMQLAPAIGRTRAHDVVHHAVAEAVDQGAGLVNTLLAHGDLSGVTEADLRRAADPALYTGLSETLARAMAKTARETLAG
ncbi:lyase family protein [Rhizobium halophytocola]|uniref:3-carboxy-cis,cis-muconate cycloisomerase n=1 Tax=Rhizobium halophytocola TaxID=735519 RepID=A0ABS4DUS2_9HYPH|nr:lyase family protein [Rhizobium halophytocola]MBP1849425.1 3-carboxy-cis,cis-muconate cycloisomerase [Rhizobium halophytocola]